METRDPLVSIGLPIYNGERFVVQAIQCVLSQTFTDWELIISDNASSDQTVTICKNFAESDKRIRLFLNDRNRGACPNFNDVFKFSRGRYFKWMAHDDLFANEFLAKCVVSLEQNDTIALAFSNLVYVDANEQPLRRQISDLNIPGLTAKDRVAQLMNRIGQSEDILWSLYGLIRRSVLLQTRLMENFNACDQVLLLEIALRGNFKQENEDLFFRREHTMAASKQVKTTASERARWHYSDDKRTLVFPYWRLFKENWRAIKESSISPSDKLQCVFSVAKRFSVQWKDLAKELISVPIEAALTGRNAS